MVEMSFTKIKLTQLNFPSIVFSYLKTDELLVLRFLNTAEWDGAVRKIVHIMQDGMTSD